MSTTFIISILVFILLFGVLFTYANMKSKNEEKAILNSFFDFATTHRGEVKEYDQLSNLVIGYASNIESLFFFNVKERGRIETVIALSEIASCRLHKPIRRSLDGRDTTLERIELILEYVQGKRPAEHITFYNLDDGSLKLQGELQLAERWHTLISNKLPSLRKAII